MANLKFTKRDGELLIDLYKHRYLTISQIQRLHFPSLQTAYRRMRILKNAGYVSVFSIANIDESVFKLAAKGISSVAGLLGVERGDLKWTDTKTKPRDYYFMRHFIAINDFRIMLKQACLKTGIKLIGFIPDYYGKKTEKGGMSKYIKDVICDISTEREQISHTPDGVFALEKDKTAALFFLEIDRGTEVVSDPEKGVLKSIRFYANYLLNGKYQRYAKDFKVDSFKGFRSLYVTTSEKRLQNIRRATKSLQVSQKAKRFHWITTLEKLRDRNVLNSVWLSIDVDDKKVYKIG